MFFPRRARDWSLRPPLDCAMTILVPRDRVPAAFSSAKIVADVIEIGLRLPPTMSMLIQLERFEEQDGPRPCIKVAPVSLAIFVHPCRHGGALTRCSIFIDSEHGNLAGPRAHELPPFADVDADDSALQRRPATATEPSGPDISAEDIGRLQKRHSFRTAVAPRLPFAAATNEPGMRVDKVSCLIRLAAKSGCASIADRNGMLVADGRPIRNSRRVSRTALAARASGQSPARANATMEPWASQRVEKRQLVV